MRITKDLLLAVCRAGGCMAGLVLGSLLTGCASTTTLRPFSTDGCSLYPDRSASTGQDWCVCCVAHDRAYWRGGTEDERRRADDALRACVQAQTGDDARAALMHSGVRLGGSALWPTWFRWGYGWGYGRAYRPLSPAEAAEADRLEAQYAAEVGFDQCPGQPRSTLLRPPTASSVVPTSPPASAPSSARTPASHEHS